MRLASVVLILALAAPLAATAQDTGQAPAQPPATRETGLPSTLRWTFNFDAAWGTFGFANSLHNNPHDPGVAQDLSDQWFEGYVKPALSGVYTTATSGEFYGKLSAAGERTYGAVPTQIAQDISSFGPDDLYIGWRSHDSLTIGENAVDVTLGRAPFKLGHGFLLYDGSSEGGSRGGYWMNARKAFEFAAIGRLQPGPHKLETFYLDRDELPEGDSGSRLWGTNYEINLGPGARTTLGATYMRWFADQALKPGRDGLNVFNVRAFSAPVDAAPGLSLEFEYAMERNGEALQSDAWTFQGAYEWSDRTWKPKVAYRYAFFEGDDPSTGANEAFDPLFPGFYDWGTWWQGEIAGEYFLSNSNLKSNMIRVHVTPSDMISGGLLFFNFSLDEPTSLGANVTDKDVALEIDAYTDWKLNKNFTLSLVAAYGDPGKAVQQSSGRTKNFLYGMAYIGYSF